MAPFEGLTSGLRNLFANAGNTPPNPDAASTKPPVDQHPIGQSGRSHFNGFIQWDETNPDWIGMEGLKRADHMWRTDADIKRDTLATWSPITAASWSVEPYGGDQATDKDREAAELCTHALWNFMQPNILTHLAEVGPILIRSGFVDFEQIWKTTTYKDKKVILPKKLDLRLPRTIWKFYQDDDGELTGIVQFLPNAANVFISATELVHYRLQAEGDNWTGTSMYRHAWKHFYYKEKLEQIDMIGQERKAVGVPVVYPPTGASEESKEEIETILANLHTNEVGFIVMPGPKAGTNVDESVGWEIDIITFDSSSSNGIRESIDQQTLKVAGAFIADFLELGHHQVGARATADVQEDPFMTAIKALSELIVAPLNEICARIATLNVPGIEGTPKLSMSLHDEASLSEISTYAQQLWAAECLTPDPQLEDYFRERADFPPADPEIRDQVQKAKQVGREQAALPPAPAGSDASQTGEVDPKDPGKGGKAMKGAQPPAAPQDPDRKLSPGGEGDKQKVNTGPAKPSRESLTLEAAGPNHNGVMVALYPTPDVASRLALPNGEAPGELHITLAYLGGIDGVDLPKLRTVVAGWAAATPPMSGQTSGLGVFAPSPGSDDQPVTYASVDIPHLTHRREHLVHALKHAGFDVSDTHGFVPHITLDYNERTDAEETVVPLAFSAVTLTAGGKREQFQLAGDATKTLDAGDETPTAAWWEQLLSQGKLKEALDGARTSMETATRPAAVKLAATMAARARLGRKIAVAAPPEELVAAFEGEMERLYAVGYQTVTDELAKQHRAQGTVPVLTAESPTDGARRRQLIKRRATIAAEHVTNEVARAAERAALAGERSPLELQRKAEAAAQGAIRKEALTNASPSVNDGRNDAALVAIALLAAAAVKEPEAPAASGRTSGTMPQTMRGIYTAVLDNRTCDYCEAADDGVERLAGDPALTVPNPECSGGEFCRCMVVWVLGPGGESGE